MNSDPQNLPEDSKFISENASKIKDRRGRHKKYHFEKHDWLPKMLGNQTRCTRSKQNYINARRALAIIKGDAELPGSIKVFIRSYLINKETVLAELGRFDNPKDLVLAAMEMSKSKMPTVKAIGFARRMRGKGSPSKRKLAKKIRRTIEAYRERHPNISEADIATAISIAYCGLSSPSK